MIWHSGSPEQVEKELNTDYLAGLSQSEASERLKVYGQNKLVEKPPRSFLQKFIDQLKDAMVIILMVAAAISLGLSVYNALNGGEPEWIDDCNHADLAINALCRVVQENKAEAA